MCRSFLSVVLVLVLPAGGGGVSAAGDLLLRVEGVRDAYVVALADGFFELSWEHSVERTPWRERYEVGPGGRILLVESEFASAGAGLPDRLHEGERFRAEGGTMRIEGRRVPVGELRVRLSGVSRHMLRIGAETIDLYGRFGEGVVTIRAMENQAGKGGCR
jgi:hypothetical protein